MDAPAEEARRGAAEQGSLVTFGIVPTGPETGYGYIKAAPVASPPPPATPPDSQPKGAKPEPKAAPPASESKSEPPKIGGFTFDATPKKEDLL